MEALKTSIGILESYRGRDKILRLIGFSCNMISGCTRGGLSRRMRIFSTEMSQCRTVLRLFDDLSMFGANLKFFYGPKDSNKVINILQTCSNILFQFYYPVEHIAWLADKKILSGVKSGIYWVICIGIWAVCLLMEIARCIIKIQRCRKELQFLKKQNFLGDPQEKDAMTEHEEAISAQTKIVQAQLQDAKLLFIQSVADFLNAINWLPFGWTLSQFKSGLYGTISSSIMLYRNFPSKSS